MVGWTPLVTSSEANEFVSQGIETSAFIIGVLTAGGGTFGYIKTGSIPSVTAGVTVGVLVCTFIPIMIPGILLVDEEFYFDSTAPILTFISTYSEAIAFSIVKITELN